MGNLRFQELGTSNEAHAQRGCPQLGAPGCFLTCDRRERGSERERERERERGREGVREREREGVRSE